MIYGYSELGGMPWEIVLKRFRAEHGPGAFPTVQACYERIRAFVNEPRFKIDEGATESLIRFSIEVIEVVRDSVADLPEGQREVNSIQELIEREIREYGEIEGTIEYVSPDLATFTKDAEDIIQSVVESVFEDIEYKPPSELLPKFAALVFAALNSPYMSDFMSGLVVFGYGETELFPQLYEVAFDCLPFGQLRTMFIDQTNVLHDGAAIYPLAEREVMDSVLRGVTPHLHEMFVETASVIASEVAERIINDNVKEDERTVSIALARKVITEVIENFGEISEEYIKDTYVYGMVETIDNMPKEDIAVLAEALVEITALRIKTSRDIESVAGPVDVCLITKGDGLIWIKRKHYFDLAKNLQYLYRRYGVPVAVPLHGGDDGAE